MLKAGVAALRFELVEDHTFDFVEGVVSHPNVLGLGQCHSEEKSQLESIQTGVKNAVATEQEYFAYYEPNNRASFCKAIRDLRQYIDSEGPFDRFFAFLTEHRWPAPFSLAYPTT